MKTGIPLRGILCEGTEPGTEASATLGEVEARPKGALRPRFARSPERPDTIEVTNSNAQGWYRGERDLTVAARETLEGDRPMNSSKAQPQAMENPQVIWSGVDVAKETFDAAVWRPGAPARGWALRTVPKQTFARTQDGVRQFLAWLDEVVAPFCAEQGPAPTVRVVMEATGSFSVELTIWMLKERPTLAPAILNPKTAHAFLDSLELRNKSDGIDAYGLSRYGAERQPAPYEPMSEERAALRSLTRYRQAIIAMRTAEQKRALEPHFDPTARQMIQKHIQTFQKDEAALEKKMLEVVESIPDLKRDAQSLDAIYGVGVLTAVTVLAELGDLRRFHRARQLTATAGLSPRNRNSGTSVHGKPRLSKRGNGHVRKALYMPAVAVIRGQNDLADLYQRLTSEGKAHKAALAAVMRKMLLVMRAILISGKPYQKHHPRRSQSPVENPVENVCRKRQRRIAVS